MPTEIIEPFTFEFKSPVGVLKCTCSDQGLRSVSITRQDQPVTQEGAIHPILVETCKQLDQYFLKKRKKFELPLDFGKATEFYKKVWGQLILIPYGQTISYKELAIRLGDENKSRAVGMANGRNPIAIVVPCHRVIGSDQSLTGYAGGLDVKLKLLELENPAVWATQTKLF